MVFILKKRNLTVPLFLLLLTAGLFINTPVFADVNDSFKPYDPFYPVSPAGEPFVLTVPSLEGRFTLSTDKKTATIFAPYTTKTSGWYDVNKVFPDNAQLCWAASCSNVIAWYLDSCEKTGANNVSLYERDFQKIFKNFTDNWKTEGYDHSQGISWYFTGQTSDGKKPANLLNYPSGRYLHSIAHLPEMFSVLKVEEGYSIKGNYPEKFPFIDDVNGSLGSTGPLSTHRNFSKTVISQLHYGPSILTVTKEGSSSTGSHAVVLWGCDFDTSTGLVKKLYIADSDDAYNADASVRTLREIKVRPRTPDSDGITMDSFYASFGEASPYTRVTGSMLLYAGGAARLKSEIPGPGPETSGDITPAPEPETSPDISPDIPPGSDIKPDTSQDIVPAPEASQDIKPEVKPVPPAPSSEGSGGGCNTGFAGLMLLTGIILKVLKKKK